MVNWHPPYNQSKVLSYIPKQAVKHFKVLRYNTGIHINHGVFVLSQDSLCSPETC